VMEDDRKELFVMEDSVCVFCVHYYTGTDAMQATGHSSLD